MNKLLQRQLQKHFGEADKVSPELTALLNVISESYDHYERDRNMMERSIELVSTEMSELNSSLKAEKEELSKVYTQLGTLFANIEEVFFSIDMVNRQLLQISQACEKVYGYAPEDFYNNVNLWRNVIVREDKAEIEKNYRLVLAGRSWTGEYRIYQKNKSAKWVETRIKPTLDHNGKLIRIDGVTADITARKEAEEKLKQNEKRYRALAENSGDAIAIFLPDGKPSYISPSIEKILGYSEKEAMELDLFSLVHPNDLEEVSKSWRKILSEPGIPHVGYTCRIIHKNGGWRWMEGTITNMLNDPAVNGIVDNFRDVTEKILVASVLRASEEKARLIVTAAMDAIIYIERQGVITSWNPQAEKIFGWKKDEIIGQPMADKIIPCWFNHLDETGMKNYFKTGQEAISNEVFETTALNCQQREFPVELTIVPIKQRETEFFCAFVRDITQKKKAEQEKEFEHNNLEALINNTHDIIWSVDRDFRLISFNHPFAESVTRLTGQTAAPGINVLEMNFTEEPIKRYRQFYEQAFSGETFTITEHSDASDGTISEVSFYPIRKGDLIVGTACYSRDITEMKKTEKQTREERFLLRTLIDHLPLNVYTKDIHSRVTLANRAEYEYAGFNSEEEILGKSDFDLHEPASAKISVADDKKVFATGQSIIGKENYHVTKNGSSKWFLKSKIPLRDDNNRITGLLGISYDITERKKIEEILQKRTDELIAIKNDLERSEKSLKEAQAIAHLGNWELDLTTYKSKWSDESFAILGVKPGEIIPSLDSFLSFVHSDDLSTVRETIGNAQKALKDCTYNCRIIRPDGILRYIYSDSRFIFDHEGKPIRLAGIMHDITDRYKAEQKLRHSEARLKQAQAIAHVGSWELSYATGKAIWSDEACKIYGLPPEENIQTLESWLSFVHPDDLGGLRREIERSETTLEGLSFNHRIVRRDGTMRYVYTESKFDFNHEGMPVGLYGIGHDVTEQTLIQQQLKSLNEQVTKRAEELAASNAELERFAYVASHDLQEPLRMVSSFLQLLQKKYNGQLDGDATQYIRHAVDGAERMKRLILDLLEYSRVGTNPEKFTATNMNEIAEQVIHMFNGKIGEAGAVINIQPMPVIRANKMQMTQLLQNLIGNALKYNESAVPEVEIGCKEEPDAWEFFVKDNGIGIEKKYYDKVFAIFQRLHNRNQYSGTGIGLAISKKIVEKHGGNIRIVSAPGKGSTFLFTIKK